MMNSFLFIIPVTPRALTNDIRKNLQEISVKNLLNQTYKNWKVLWISNESPNFNDSRFIHVKFEGLKEEKLQIASRFIIQNNLKPDYIIRLDDDDIFNPHLLDSIKDVSFDILVDKHQVFWYYNSSYYSSRVWYWFPNTCIHKREHALQKFGKLASPRIKKLNEQIRLIENDHSKIHNYYKNKEVKFSSRKNPIYIRSISSTSITYLNKIEVKNYLLKFGSWRKEKYSGFYNLTGKTELPLSISLKQRANNIINDLIALKNYKNIVLN